MWFSGSVEPAPTLYRLASQRKYEKLIAHVGKHPQDASWTDNYGNTSLHLLCQTQIQDEFLVPAIESVVAVDATLICRPNNMGWTPLHLASSKRLCTRPSARHSNMLVRLIAVGDRQAVSAVTLVGFKRMTPFHIVCEANAPYKVLKAMLEVNPELATQSCVEKEACDMAEHPICLLWKSSSFLMNRNDLHAKKDLMDKMALLVLTAHYGSVRDPLPRHHLVHAACAYRCPRDYMMRLLSSENDSQITTPDEGGSLPLHYTVERASVDSQSYTTFVIDRLLQRYAQAASVVDSRTGKLPLHIALESKMTWHKGGVKELVYAHPLALRKRDVESGLYPFMEAATHALSSRLHLSSTFELLRAAPDMCQRNELNSDQFDA